MKTGLILEGGGMRGGYTAGVLDSFLDAGIEFPYCIAVSAGACNALSYIAKQRKRYYYANTRYLKDWHYMGVRCFLRTGHFFGNRFVFDDITYKLVPLDIDGFEREAARCPLTVVTTDLRTGGPLYDLCTSVRENAALVEASSSLPLLSPVVDYKGIPRADGGVSDSIPVGRALADGCDRVVAVLTQDASYRKSPNKMVPLFRLAYPKYPKLAEAMARRHEAYNAALDELSRLEKEGRALVIRPKKPVEIRRMERDAGKITALYEDGIRDGAEAAPHVLRFLEGNAP